MAGSWRLDQFNAQASLMDQGGNPKVMFAVGPDGIGGTPDDIDVDFTEDALNPHEGFTGIEDTVARTAWLPQSPSGAPVSRSLPSDRRSQRSTLISARNRSSWLTTTNAPW